MRNDGEPAGPGIGTTRRMSRTSQSAKEYGTRSAETIKASGSTTPHQQAGHKTAPDQGITSEYFLQTGSHPHRTFYFIFPNPI